MKISAKHYEQEFNLLDAKFVIICNLVKMLIKEATQIN